MERLEFTFNHIPALGRHLARLPEILGGRTALLLAGNRGRRSGRRGPRASGLKGLRRVFDRLTANSPLRAFGRAVLLDWSRRGRLVGGRPPGARPDRRQPERGRQARQQIFQALLYWRGFNLVFRVWLRPDAPEGRIAPVDDTAAARLLVGLNWVIILPLLGGHDARALLRRPAPRREVVMRPSSSMRRSSPAGLLWVVWHWRHEMAAWLTAMVPAERLRPQLKLSRRRAGGSAAWPSTA